MKSRFVKITQSDDYKHTCAEDYSEYYQFHILSYSQIISTYYKKSDVDFDLFKDDIALLQKQVKRKSSLVDNIQLYEKDGIFLLTDSKEFINSIELFEFDISKGCYEYIEGIDLFDYLLDKEVDVFFKNALSTVGASELIPKVENLLLDLRAEQISINEMIQKTRNEDHTSPKYIVEIYKIEKNYIPVKTKEFKCATPNSVYILPEIKIMIAGNDRIISIVKEIATGKTIEGSLEEAIESIKYDKWAMKNPTIMDPEIMMRMELDNDDPNFISYDDYFGNLVEYEDGDDEYEPRF